MVHDLPRHPRSHDYVERANGDYQGHANFFYWVVGLKFVQQTTNASYHAVIKRTRYTAMFGTEPKVGLTLSSIRRRTSSV